MNIRSLSVDYPPGWDEKRVRAVIAHYDRQSEDEAVAEYEAAVAGRTGSVERYAQLMPGADFASEVAEPSPEYDGDEAPRRDDDS